MAALKEHEIEQDLCRQERDEERRQKEDMFEQELSAPYRNVEKYTLVWLALNVLLVRPVCAWLNARAFDDWRCPVRAPPAVPRSLELNKTGVEVILASPGDLRTTSMQVALEAMGLRTYRSAETGFYLQDILKPDIAVEDLAQPLRECGVRAIAPEPWLDLVPKLLAASPDAKVILMKPEWRDWARSMRQSLKTRPFRVAPHSYFSVFMSLLLCHWLPYGLLWPAEDRGHSLITDRMSSLLLQHCISWHRMQYLPRSYYDPMVYGEPGQRRGSGLLDNATLYLRYWKEVWASVPPDRRLEFDFWRHGWDDLAAFLARPAPLAGTPFPRVGLRSLSPDIAEWWLFPRRYIGFWVLLLLSVVANWLAYCGILWFLSRYNIIKYDYGMLEKVNHLLDANEKLDGLAKSQEDRGKAGAASQAKCPRIDEGEEEETAPTTAELVPGESSSEQQLRRRWPGGRGRGHNGDGTEAEEEEKGDEKAARCG